MRCSHNDSLVAASRARADTVPTEAALTWLHLNGFISWDDAARKLSGTDLGKAAAFTGMDPDRALGVQGGGC